MSGSYAGQVNQQLYHAGLLLELLGHLDADALSYRAQQQALENAAGQAMYAAYRLFLLEVAQACQLRQQPQSLTQLQELLAEEQRSHAVVETLSVLEQDATSWLAVLLQAQQSLVGDASVAVSRQAVTDLLAVSDVTDKLDTAACLHQFKALVAEQRAYLQEW